MPSANIQLEVAAFVDDAQDRVEVSQAELRRFGQAVLEACYDGLGLAPKLLDGESVAELLLRALPARLKPRDPLGQHAASLLEAFVVHIESTQVMTQAFEVRSAIGNHLERFRAAVESGEHAGTAPAKKSEPFVHGAPKTGRNDPCFCGSGKKFKKCHGKS